MFQPLTTELLPELWKRQQNLHALSSEFDAFRLYVWQQLDHSQIAFWRNQFALRCMVDNKPLYIAPYETEDFQTLLTTLMEYEKSLGGSTFRFLNVQRDASLFPDTFTATPRRDLYDYLYNAQDLTEFRGRAYAAKRNQIAQFKRKYNWSFEPIGADNRDAVFAITDAWASEHSGDMVNAERDAIRRMVLLEGDYGQSGGILFANGQPAAFAIGTHPRRELLDIVAEKALPQYTGAYAMIIQAYAQYAYSLASFDFINREEDMGLENLRNAKMQLKPVQLIEKTLMTATLNV